MISNESGRAIRPTRSQATSINDLIFTTFELSTMDSWAIDEELATPSDYELIVFNMANLDEKKAGIGTSREITR